LASPAPALVDVSGLSQAIRGRARARRRVLHDPPGRGPGTHRAERRGEDDAVRVPRRPAAADSTSYFTDYVVTTK